MGSNIGTYLDQLWVSNIVKTKRSYKQKPHGWSLPIPINNAIRQIPMDESHELTLQHTNAYKLILTLQFKSPLYASDCLCKVAKIITKTV